MPTLHHHPRFHSPQLDRVRGLRILLPRQYHQQPQRRYPVVYLHDGQNLFEPHTAAFRHWRLREHMARQPLYRQAILVGIDHGGPERLHEYAPHRRAGALARGRQYLDFVAHTVKPFVDAHYRTWPHREATAMVGASLGGLISWYAGMEYSHVFGKIGVLSPAFWASPGVLQLAKKPAAGPRSQIYVAGSRTESRYMASTLERSYRALRDGGYHEAEYRVVLRDRGRHNELLWQREFAQMYEWLFPRTAF